LHINEALCIMEEACYGKTSRAAHVEEQRIGIGFAHQVENLAPC